MSRNSLFFHFTIKEFRKRLKPLLSPILPNSYFTIKEFRKRLKHRAGANGSLRDFTIKEFRKRLKLGQVSGISL